MSSRVSRRLTIFCTLALIGAAVAAGCAARQSARRAAPQQPIKYFSNWPEGKSPEEIGKLVADRFVARPRQVSSRPTTRRGNRGGASTTRGAGAATRTAGAATTRGASTTRFAGATRPARDRVIYPEVCTWYGGLTFASETGNEVLRGQLVRLFDPLFGPQRRRIPLPDHVDHTVFAAVPLELYMQTRDQRYLKLGKDMTDAQWGEPFGAATTQPAAMEFHKKGYTWQTRMWIDDMYMITAAQAQAYRATGDRTYIDRAAKEMVLYLDELQKENGLFYHAPDVPFFWGRGDGWMAAGMAELLRSLPTDHPDRPRIMQGYRLMMESLLKYQDDRGMWHQLIDDPQGSWAETSCTGMFAFAFITGVKNGWLEADVYGPAARKAWLALTDYIEPNGAIREVCEGTNKKNDRQYYLDRRRVTGDLHGQAPVLWCATALLREPGE